MRANKNRFHLAEDGRGALPRPIFLQEVPVISGYKGVAA